METDYERITAIELKDLLAENNIEVDLGMRTRSDYRAYLYGQHGWYKKNGTFVVHTYTIDFLNGDILIDLGGKKLFKGSLETPTVFADLLQFMKTQMVTVPLGQQNYY